ncbi:hypothetical protein ACP4OV_007057 [Aristida adscensionis]
MDAPSAAVRIVSSRVVRPDPASSPDAGVPSEPVMHLTPWDLKYLSVNYIQKGVLLPKPPTTAGGGAHLVDDLAASFARALGRFHPLAGRLAVTAAGVDDGEPGATIVVSLRCNSEGAEFVHAVAPAVTVGHVAAALYTPPVVRSFFPLNGLLCGGAALDARPVLAAQVTELADGVFVAVSLNHCVADGTTFWHFLNTWSEIHRSGGRGGDRELSTPPPVLHRWFPDTCPVPVTLPFGKLEDVIRRFECPPVRECFFHFSGESVKQLKAKANDEIASTATATATVTTISSLQALIAHVWRATCRARVLSPDRETSCRQPIGCRRRVKGVAEHYMGCAVAKGLATSTVGEVLGRGLGWTASQLASQAVASFDEAGTRDTLASWHRKPDVLYVEAPGDPADVVLAGSPRFDVYGNDFGWGVPATARSGAGNKADGLVTVYAGRGGGGSMALEVCLSPPALERLVADAEFMEAVSTAPM